MFNTTRRRLVILNTVVFLFVLILLSSLLYIHMRYRLYHDIDEALSVAENRSQTYHNLSEYVRADEHDSQKDEQTTFLFWDAQGQLIGQSPKQSLSLDVVNQFRGAETTRTLQTKEVEKQHYRILQFPNRNTSSTRIVSIGIIKNLEDTNNTLRSLLWDIVAGIIAGLVISILAGLFLARRALVPIRISWDKQQQFVADASHELRTPAAVIRARTELLLRYPSHSIEEESPNIAVILSESNRMSKLLDDLLTLARSDSNQLQLQCSDIALDSLLRELSDQFKLLASTKDVEITTELQQPLALWGDESRIRQLLIILLDNALKYTPSSGRIEITAHYQSHHVHISVSDNGCGIAEDELPYVFERFYRGDKVRSRAEGGTGLGLSIAKWIAQEHGGVIQIASKPTGTKVELLFPKRKH